jgi:hypothetical protein
MKMYFHYIKHPIAALVPILLLFLGAFTSCNAHQKAAKLIGNTVREHFGKFTQNEEVSLENKINQLDRMIPNPSVSDIFSEKTELIATQ